MVSQNSYGDIIVSIKERKQFENKTTKVSSEKKCTRCGNNLLKNGISKIPGVCQNCIDTSLRKLR